MTTFDEVYAYFAEGAVIVEGKKVKLDVGDADHIFLDGVTGEVSQKDEPADTTIKLGLSDLIDMAKGKLDSTAAFIQGRLRVEGDLGVAMQMQSLVSMRG